MVLGKVAHNLMIAGRALVVVGFGVKNRGTKASAEADAFESEVNVAVARINCV